MTKVNTLLVVGEIVVDFTLPKIDTECKLRLGGIVHAARGLWASDLEYSVGAFCPEYLVDEATNYLVAHGCNEFIWLGDIIGSPNVIVIGDATEVSYQDYEDLLRDKKKITLFDSLPNLEDYKKIMIFPGKFDINELLERFSLDAKFSLDIAYDVENLDMLNALRGRIQAIITSTSSPLFTEIGKNCIDELINKLSTLSPDVFLLKENRGGSRLFNLIDESVEEIPASLSKTVNSVGVGDSYSAVMYGFSGRGWIEAAWRGCQVATVYSQTTYPDDLKRDVKRSLNLSVTQLRELGGSILPWHDRQHFSIYLAGPDFSYVKKLEYDRVVESLEYHNFKVRRPIQENGELERPASKANLKHMYSKDYQLLTECDVIFAIPLGRDPGTLVEIGIAIALNKPVITYDPREENNNTMVMAGSSIYSADLDECLNGIFSILAKLRAGSR